ncbi:hypothetical protein C3L33_15734, partial [Rhododendron williamsianum]
MSPNVAKYKLSWHYHPRHGLDFELLELNDLIRSGSSLKLICSMWVNLPSTLTWTRLAPCALQGDSDLVGHILSWSRLRPAQDVKSVLDPGYKLDESTSLGHGCIVDIMAMSIEDVNERLHVARNASKFGWFVTFLVLAVVSTAGIAGYVFYKYRLRSYMDSEIMAIMSQYMPLDSQKINQVVHHDSEPLRQGSVVV